MEKVEEHDKKGQCKNKMESLKAKKLQSEIPLKYDEEDYGWLKRNTDPRKTTSVYSLQEQMVKTTAWKKVRRLIDDEMCRVCGETKETVQHLLAGCKKLAGTEYVRRHNNALKVLAVWWAVKKRLLPEGTKWYDVRWEKGTVIERDGKKLLFDWEYRMRTNCTTRRPDLTLEDIDNKIVIVIDMAYPDEINKEETRTEKIRKYQQLCYEIRERREGYTVKMIPSVVGCLGSGMKQLKIDFSVASFHFLNCSTMEKSWIRLYIRCKRLFFGKANRLFEKYCQEYR